MEFKSQIEKLLKTLKDKGVERGKIEEDLGYSENYIDQMLAKGGNKRFLTALQKYVLQKATPGNGQQFHTSGADPPPAFVPIPWQEYLQLIHLSLEALKAGQNEILLQQAKTRAEVRGYGKYHLVKDSKGRSETFDKLLAEVDKLVNGELTQDDAQDNSPGS